VKRPHRSDGSLGRIAAFPSSPIRCQRAEVFSAAPLFYDFIRFRTDKQLIVIVKEFGIVGVVLTLLDLLGDHDSMAVAGCVKGGASKLHTVQRP
jgi:hypothetical protein